MIKQWPTYQQWRRQFLLDRLPLVCRLGIFLRLGFLLFEVLDSPMRQNINKTAQSFVEAERWLPWCEAILSIFALLSVAWLLEKVPRIRRSPHRLIPLLPLAFVVIPELPDLLLVTPDSFRINGMALAIIILSQAILLPVYWRSHLISQATTLSFLPVSFAWILLSQWDNLQADGHFINGTLTENISQLLTFMSYQLLLGAIALLIVWVQERFWIKEFDLRNRLQLLLHAVSHDLRPSATGSVMLLQQLIDNQNSETHTSKSQAVDITISSDILNQMIASGERQLKLIESLNTVYTDTVKIEPQSVHLKPLTVSILQEMQPLLTEANITTSQLIASELPTVWADPFQLRRVYKNLISNAIAYNPTSIHLVFTATVQGQCLRCTVEDNGQGLSSEQCQQLFERYAHTRDTRHPLHLGLGLYICHQIITAHGGQIGVDSHVTEGACFWFTLPLSPDRT